MRLSRGAEAATACTMEVNTPVEVGVIVERAAGGFEQVDSGRVRWRGGRSRNGASKYLQYAREADVSRAHVRLISGPLP